MTAYLICALIYFVFTGVTQFIAGATWTGEPKAPPGAFSYAIAAMISSVFAAFALLFLIS